MSVHVKKNIDASFKVTDEEALTLMFHYLDMAVLLFEAGPLQPEVINAFYQQYGDSEEIGTATKRKFLENLNQEYVDAFDNESEAQDGESEGA